MLRIQPENGESLGVAGGELRHVESRSDVEIFGRLGDEGWRLGILRPVAADIGALLPDKVVYGGWIDRLGLARTLAVAAFLSGLLLTAGYFAPRLLAPLVPLAWEQKFGNLLVGDLGKRFCSAPDGQDALDRLAAKLSPEAGHYKVRVVDLPMVNAVALPGGNIVLFKPLLKEAESPDEVAGVLAHEIAHIERRHVTEAMIRHYGLGVILASFGGATGASIETLASAGYSRSAESEADQGSVAALARANISPRPTSRFFDRLGKGERALGRLAEPLSYLASHPLSAERRERFEESFDPRRRYAASLSERDWKALRDICSAGPSR